MKHVIRLDEYEKQFPNDTCPGNTETFKGPWVAGCGLVFTKLPNHLEWNWIDWCADGDRSKPTISEIDCPGCLVALDRFLEGYTPENAPTGL